MPPTFKRLTLPAVLAAVVSPAFAQPLLEEVIVTATKREEGLQDVPIAISVMSGEAMTELGIANLTDLTVFMPNIHVNEAGTGTQLFIRGVGSGVNYGFEQSVGTFIDGVYYGRGRSARGQFLDVARVEVLKGPQSTLFGKNTIAGAINITTNRPGDELESYVDVGYRTEFDGYMIEGMVNVPVSDTVKARFSGRYYEDDGYVENLAAGGEDGPRREDMTLRAVIDWTPTEDLTLSFKAEHNKNDVYGRQQVISRASPAATGLYRAFGDPGFTAGLDWQQYDQNISPDVIEHSGRPYRSGVFDETETDLLQLTADWRLGEHTLRSITAWLDYEFTNELDVDYSPLRFLGRGRTEAYEQFTQEFILSSPTGGFLEYLAGVFYQSEELDNNRHTFAIFSALPPVEGAILGNIAGALGVPSLPPTTLDGDATSEFSQEAETLSVFTELTFNLSDSLRLTAGLRYSQDEKSMDKSGDIINLSGVLPDPVFKQVWSPAVLALADVHAFSRTRSESHVIGNINLQYDVNADTMAYVNIANGYKAGGFDEDNALGREDVAEFEDESVTSIEIGAKMTLGGGAGRFNVAYFNNVYEDIQVSTFDGNCCFVVGNAAEAEVQGIEADLTYALTEGLTVNLAAAWLDAVYSEFADAACNEAQIIDWIGAGNARATCVQDLGGENLQFAPEYTFNIGFRYDRPIGAGLRLAIGADYLWSDDVVVGNDLDPELIQDAVGKVNANISLGASDDRWELSLIGRNLTDEKTFPWGNDVPLAGLGFSGSYFKFIDPPAHAELRLRVNF
ncbi:TonB-dependent receptor [Pseudohaliea rubra]|uniref:TonB-dependent receptor n=1 Tax=Pseudohaliea rubra DSM 19751 TaxID=1265313 RepID=A0A095VMQ8_9GAMM|nr:TonB-dependent receptor [Pseudohaliea rubra]KGE02645.1 TonB-dependent receptor [Pseudohaliea rubra DSM 19751]